jgi:hypothetical protein
MEWDEYFDSAARGRRPTSDLEWIFAVAGLRDYSPPPDVDRQRRLL